MNGHKDKEEMDVDEKKEKTEQEINISPSSNLSFLDINNIEFVLSKFKLKSIGRNHIEQYIEIFNENESINEIKLSKTITCISNQSKTILFRISIYIQNLFVMEIKYIQPKNNEPFIDGNNINIFEWNEYKLKRNKTQNNQCIVELSSYCLFQKLTIHSRVFYKQIYKKINKKKDNNINSSIIILHRLIIWLS
eukprot:71080_1